MAAPIKIDIDKAIIARTKGQSLRQIAKDQGLHHSAIHASLSRFTDNALTREFTAKRAAILQGLQANILDSIQDEDVKAASLLQRVTAVGILHDKERLELGQATSISELDIRALVALIQPTK